MRHSCWSLCHRTGVAGRSAISTLRYFIGAVGVPVAAGPHARLVEVDLIAAQTDRLAHPQAVMVERQREPVIASARPGNPARPDPSIQGRLPAMAISPPSPSTEPAREVLAGLVERVTFHNEENGF